MIVQCKIVNQLQNYHQRLELPADFEIKVQDKCNSQKGIVCHFLRLADGLIICGQVREIVMLVFMHWKKRSAK